MGSVRRDSESIAARRMELIEWLLNSLFVDVAHFA